MVKVISILFFLCIGLSKSQAKIAPVSNDITSVFDENDTPIIGILSQEISYYLNKNYPDQFKSYIAASYVKFVEGGGARVVPIWIDQPREYYVDILGKINGVLFPGGATFFNSSRGYAEAGRYIYDIAVEMNENGHYMPIWGTCLGFELLTFLASENNEHRARCDSMSQSLPLEFKQGFRKSRLFGGAPEDVIQILQSKAVTPNFHQFCVTEQNFTNLGLDEHWIVMSVNRDLNDFEFISTIEHKKYPFYGVQFHPEKNIYEWVGNKNISHTPEAIRAAQYFSEFFIDESRKSMNRFSNKNEENDHLIYNFAPSFTGRKGSSFIQSYLFPNGADYGNCRSTGNTSMPFAFIIALLYIIPLFTMQL